MQNIFSFLLVVFCLQIVCGAEFNANGTFSGKSGTLQFNSKTGQVVFSANDGFCFPFYVEYLLPDGTFYKTYSFTSFRKEIDIKKKSVFLKGECLQNGEGVFPVILTLSFSPDQKRIVLSLPMDQRIDERKIQRRLCIKVPFRCSPQRKMFLDGREIDPGKEDSSKPMVVPWHGRFKELLFSSLSGNYKLKIYPPDVKWSLWKQNRSNGYYCGFFIPFPKGKDAVFEFDIDTLADLERFPPKRIGGVNFQTDGLEIPQNPASRNLIPNSSFEAEFDSWQEYWHGEVFQKAPSGEFYSIDTTTAVHGKKSLRMVSPAGQFLSPLCPFVIPVDEQEMLTLSFYAKTDKPGIANLAVMGHGIRVLPHSPLQYNFRPGKEWRRFSLTFPTLSKMLIVAIASYKPSEDCIIWIDGIQLERGEKMTEYVDNTFPVYLKTGDRSCAVWGSGPFHAKLISVEEPGREKIYWSVSDFFGKKKMFGVKEWKSTTELPELNRLPFGSFVLKLEIPGFGKRHFRLIRMHDLQGNFRNRRIFGVPGISERTAVFRRRLEIYKKTGIGTMLSFQPFWDEMTKLLFCSHIRPIGYLLPGKVLGKYSITRVKKPEESILNLKDSELPLIEKEVYYRAKCNSNVKIWKICNEPHLTQEEMVRAVDVFVAARRGLHNAIPDAQILTPEPTNIGDGGRNELLDWLHYGCSRICDLPAIHTYGSPDFQLDSNLRTLLTSLSSLMPGKKLYLTEGIYYTQYNLPDLNLYAYYNNSLADHFRLGAFGYEIGNGERASLANTMRSRIVALKYAENLGCDIDWTFKTGHQVLGYDGIPKSIFFSINTPAYLLGNAVFIRDLSLGEQILGYLFEDAQKRPVAVLWNCNPDVLSGQKKGNRLNLSLLREHCEVFDLMGNRLSERTTLNLDGYPLFLRGEPGKTAAFSAAFETQGFCDAAGSNIRFGYAFSRDGAFYLSLENLNRQKLSGKLTVSRNEKQQIEEKCEIEPKTTYRTHLFLPLNSELQTSRISAEFKNSFQTERMETEISSAGVFPVPQNFSPDGDLSEWKNHFFWKLKNHRIYDKTCMDSSSGAEMAVGWDTQKLYFAFRVHDETFFPVTPIQQSWTGDGVQLYFDSLANAGKQRESRYDGDDQSYLVGFEQGGRVEVFRNLAPNPQQAFVKRGPVSTAEGGFRRTKEGWCLELAIPFSELEPIRLRENSVFGMSAVVNDNDGNGRKQAFFLNCSGEAYQNPKGYPIFYLKGKRK